MDEKIIAQAIARNQSQRQLEHSMMQLLDLLEFTENHISKTDAIKSITIKNKMFTLKITHN